MASHHESNAPLLAAQPPYPPSPSFAKAREALGLISMSPATTLRQALRQVTEIAATTLRVKRVSVWRLVVDGRVLMCEYLHQYGEQGVYEGSVLHEKDFPQYFKTLEEKQVIPIEDVEGELLTSEFREPYLKPLRIASMLDAPILTGDDVCGVVCHESIDEKRAWNVVECEFAKTVAATISRLHVEWVQFKIARISGDNPTRNLELERMITLGRLAAGMAHDFKNVLAIITGYADLILALASDSASWSQVSRDKLSGYAEEIQAAANQGEWLTHQLMALGHEAPHKPAVLELRSFLTGYRNILSMAAKPGIQLAFEVDTPVSRIFFDKMHMERALLNLVMNAGDAMPLGGRIAIRLSEVDRSGESGESDRFVALEIVDQGTGMSKEIQQRIFEPYFTTKGVKGTGLGMAIVRQIVYSAGGSLEIDSQINRGTVIRMLLPRIAQA